MMHANLIRVDELIRPDHYYLDCTDECYFWGEYTARKGYGHSETNQLIYNFKKPNTEKDKYSYQYKAKAIKHISGLLAKHLSSVFAKTTIVPIPPSKAKNHPDHDDRLVQVLSHLAASVPDLHFCELVTQTVSVQAVHNNADRPPPNSIIEHYLVDQGHLHSLRENILIFDDVLTTGSHFKAMKNIILDVKPDANVMGLFVARRIPEADFI